MSVEFDDVQPSAKLQAHPLFQPSPAHTPGVLVSQHGEDVGHPLRFFIYRDVLDELKRSFEALPRRCATALIGTLRLDAQGPYVEVVGFEGLLALDETQPIDVKLQPELERLLRPGTPQSQITIGWAAHLPGDGAAFTEEVMRTHMTLFSTRFQMSLILDLAADKIAGYVLEPGKGFTNPPLFLVGGLAPESP